MDEKHWFLNTSFSGFVLLVVFITGSWCFGDCPLLQLPRLSKDNGFTLAGLAGLVLVLPFVGMIVKAFSVAIFRRWHYEGLAWRVMGELARDRLKQPFSETEWPSRGREIHETLDKAQIDSLVSWLRLGEEDDKITQWRRNRGHYMHSAENSLTASILGFVLAVVYALIHWFKWCTISYSYEWKLGLLVSVVLFVLVFGIWIRVLWEVRTVMGQTNDEILLAWMIERMGLVDKQTILLPKYLDELSTKEGNCRDD